MKISKFMCHDIRTADKFYVTNLSAQQAMEQRRLFESALEGPERSPPRQPTPKKRKRPAEKSKASTKIPRTHIGQYHSREDGGPLSGVWDIQSRVHRGKLTSCNQIEPTVLDRFSWSWSISHYVFFSPLTAWRREPRGDWRWKEGRKEGRKRKEEQREEQEVEPS